jgi:hypothetical protein
MDFEVYYKSQFEADLRTLIAAIPHRWQHSLWDDPAAYSIQVERLKEGDAIEVIPINRRPLFAVCLCWTVLIDQAVFTYARSYYPEFRSLSRYPKLTGNGTWSHRCTTPFFAIEWMGYGVPDGKAKALALLPTAREHFSRDIPESFMKFFSVPVEVSRRIFDECTRELDSTAR